MTTRKKYPDHYVAVIEAVVVGLLLYAVSFTGAYQRIGHAVDDLVRGVAARLKMQ